MDPETASRVIAEAVFFVSKKLKIIITANWNATSVTYMLDNMTLWDRKF
jgi:hypothetical protein